MDNAIKLMERIEHLAAHYKGTSKTWQQHVEALRSDGNLALAEFYQGVASAQLSFSAELMRMLEDAPECIEARKQSTGG